MLALPKSPLVLSLCQQYCMDKLHFQLEECMGAGMDGECYSLVGDPNRVVKLSVLCQRPGSSLADQYQAIEDVLATIMHDHPQAYIYVYGQEYLGAYHLKDHPWFGDQNIILYYYLMDRLLPLTEDECKVFHSILSHEDRGVEKDLSPPKLRKILEGMGRGLEFDYPKVVQFCQHIQQAPVEHCDLHPRNILKDNNNNFKLIDVDRCRIRAAHSPII